MEYEMPDGSIFSLREIWTEDDPPQFEYTSVTAIIDSKPYAARVDQYEEDIDHFEVAEALTQVPPENIYPLFREAFTRAPPFNPVNHYLKSPSFTWSDTGAGNTFVADCVSQEVKALEMLTLNPHPSLVKYHGCVVSSANRITHICLEKARWSLIEYLDDVQPSQEEARDIYRDLDSALDHLHSLGYAHNDVKELNVCINKENKAILIDFDSCLPFGQRLLKGVSANGSSISDKENDSQGLEEIAYVLGVRNG